MPYLNEQTFAPGPVTWTTRADWPADKTPAAEQALDVWACYTGVEFVSTDDPDATVTFGYNPLPAYPQYEAVAESTWNADGYFTDFDITLDSDHAPLSWSWMAQDGSPVFDDLLHEIGHAFLDHNDDWSVMNDAAGSGVFNEITHVDLTYRDAQVLEARYPLRSGTYNDDTVTGGPEIERLFGHAGDDTIYGNDGDQTVYGNEGADHVYGNQGADVLLGGRNDDLLFGGQDDDVLYGNKGADTLWGGKGADGFAADPDDTIADFNPSEGDYLI